MLLVTEAVVHAEGNAAATEFYNNISISGFGKLVALPGFKVRKVAPVVTRSHNDCGQFFCGFNFGKNHIQRNPRAVIALNIQRIWGAKRAGCRFTFGIMEWQKRSYG